MGLLVVRKDPTWKTHVGLGSYSSSSGLGRQDRTTATSNETAC